MKARSRSKSKNSSLRDLPPVRPFRPRKRFGQHFLQESWALKVVRAINVAPDDAFVEIGPGTGALTKPLADGAGTALRRSYYR